MTRKRLKWFIANVVVVSARDPLQMTRDLLLLCLHYCSCCRRLMFVRKFTGHSRFSQSSNF